MTPLELINAATEIHQRWPDALIYINPAPTPNGHIRNPEIPQGRQVLAVDVDRVWPHQCQTRDDDCNLCCGWWELVAWINLADGKVHHIDVPYRIGDEWW